MFCHFGTSLRVLNYCSVTGLDWFYTSLYAISVPSIKVISPTELTFLTRVKNSVQDCKTRAELSEAGSRQKNWKYQLG